MKLNDVQRQWLHDALRSLETGSVKQYHDAMWLGFGDVWSQLETHLSNNGAIRVQGRHGENVALTPLGAQLARELVPVAVAS